MCVSWDHLAAQCSTTQYPLQSPVTLSLSPSGDLLTELLEGARCIAVRQRVETRLALLSQA